MALLAERGASFFQRNKDGATPLHRFSRLVQKKTRDAAGPPAGEAALAAALADLIRSQAQPASPASRAAGKRKLEAIFSAAEEAASFRDPRRRVVLTHAFAAVVRAVADA